MAHQRNIGVLLSKGLGLLIGAILCGSAAAQSGAPGTTSAIAAGNPDPTPILRIETGMHGAPITRIATDAQCALLATGSRDETVRLWSMPEGKLLRTQRLSIGLGNEGLVYAVAVSPDGQWVAEGGWDAATTAKGNNGVYVFDSATATSVRRLGTFPDVVFHIAFSPDGQRLAVALGTGGIRVLNVADGRQLMADSDFGGQSSYGLAFAADGSLFAVGDDAQLRRYGTDLKRSARVATVGGKQPYSVAVDPTGQRVAVGFQDSSTVNIYDAKTLRRIATVETADITAGTFHNVAWSQDGTRLFAGGGARQGFHSIIRTWTRDGQRIGPDVAMTDNAIASLTPCGEAIAFGDGGGAFGLLRPDGTAVTLGRSRTIDPRNKLGDAFTVSTTASAFVSVSATALPNQSFSIWHRRY